MLKEEFEVNGIILKKLKVIRHPKGNIWHALKISDPGFCGFGEAYFSSIYFNEKKGWKNHTAMTCNFIVPHGNILFTLVDGRIDSTTYRKRFDIELSKEFYYRLTVPPGVWVAFLGKMEPYSLLLNIANMEHDSSEAVGLDVESDPTQLERVVVI